MRNPVQFFLTAVVFGVGGFFLQRAMAAVPQMAPVATYVGKLTDNGVPAEGPRDIRLEIYNVPSGGAFLCQSAGGQVDVTQGVFRIPLPQTCEDALRNNGDTWVDIKVSGASLGRVKVGAVPYALEANRAAVADRLTVMEDWTTLPVNMTRGEDDSIATNQTTTGRFRRVGDTLHFQIRTTYSGTPAPVSARYDWKLPSPYVLDATKLVIEDSLVGSAVLSNGGSVQLGATTADALGLHVYTNGGAYYQTSSFGVGAGGVTLTGYVPIVVP